MTFKRAVVSNSEQPTYRLGERGVGYDVGLEILVPATDQLGCVCVRVCVVGVMGGGGGAGVWTDLPGLGRQHCSGLGETKYR